MSEVKPFHRAQALESVLQLATFALEQGSRLGVTSAHPILRAHMAAVREMMNEEMPDYREWLEDMRQAELAQERHEVDNPPMCTGFDYSADIYCHRQPVPGTSLCSQCADGPEEP